MTTAKWLVANDVRRSYPEMTNDEAIAHARNTLDPAYLDDEPEELAAAYRLVLQAVS